MIISVVAASSLLAVVLVLALVREVRLRRALQMLLHRLLAHWRFHEKTNDDADTPDRRAGHNDARL
jgi:hypothetical protein